MRKKCVVVPVHVQPTPYLCQRISEWIKINVPEWGYFQVDGKLKYLGAWLGPDAGKRLRICPAAKYRKRALKICASRAAPAAAIAEYNSRAVPTLGYIAQLAPLPAYVWRHDVDNARRMYGFAHSISVARYSVFLRSNPPVCSVGLHSLGLPPRL